MNKAILIALAAFTALAAVSQIMPIAQTRFLGVADEREAAFTQWMMKQGKSYGTSTEKEFRLATFKTNYDFVTETNAKQSNYWLELNKFADMTKEELATYRGMKSAAPKKSGNTAPVLTFPSSVDQRNNGLVSHVKDQGQCGSCWAFSTIGGVEGFHAQSTGTMQTYSEQQLVDCAGGSYGNLGCSGGLMDNALRYIEDHGITTESAYPYTAQNGTCSYNGGGYKTHSHQDIAQSVSGLKSAIATRPVSIAVDAQSWSFYGGGVFDNCGSSLDHGVLAVGYTSDYWIVKNSWGASWGESGYIRLAMGNTCGLLNSASYPTA